MATTLTRNRMLRRVSAAVVAAVLMHRGADAAELSACVDQSSPAAAMDAKVIKAVARQLVMTPRIENFDGSSDDDDGLSPKEFRKLLAGRCDLVMGFPVDAHGGSVPDGLLASAPYAATGFVLVTRDRAVARIDALPEHGERRGLSLIGSILVGFLADMAAEEALLFGHVAGGKDILIAGAAPPIDDDAVIGDDACVPG